ncbi:hypothetical protein [Actinoplanes sp. DH11]|uniref:LppU/SCO3897 family protein n=1 Tax=Actinoplanes sp. DH11 TaxID=2857011 RepID=UPI001E577D64|nr:hypothetical protein [Actinoplanes sp. DH11]
MSQNGPTPGQPPRPGRGADEPYAEPSDPWSEHEQPQPWSPPPAPPIPQQPYAQDWIQKSQPARRGFAMGALVAVLSVLVGGGVATVAWFLVGREDEEPPAVTAATTPAGTGPRPQTSEDARFAAKGQCVRNDGTNLEPKLRVVSCAANTYQVLARIEGRTTGDKDAMGKCSKVKNYTKWYYYDTEYDDVDVVLCLREYGTL